MTKPSTLQRIKTLAAMRVEADDRVGSRADIVGSMIGLKCQNGKITDRVGITYLVKEKIPNAELNPKKRIPGRMKIGRNSVTTDVIVWPKMVEQSMEELLIYDQRRQGTLSCFAVSGDERFGVSCAHCLAGADRNPATPTEVSFWSGPVDKWVPVGKSVYLTYAPGRGIEGDYGYLDCGIFDLRNKSLLARAQSGTPLEVIYDLYSMVQRRVYGISALKASASQAREATVIAVEQWAIDGSSDIVLNVDEPGTFGGDSGMLWLTEEGRAFAIHARGENRPAGTGSLLTTAMSAARVCQSLDVRLVLG